MKQLINKTLIILAIFFGGLALPAGEVKADTFSAGYTTATVNIDKTNYFIGEGIVTTASITALWCRNTSSWSYIHASTKPLNTDFGVMVVMLTTGGSYSLPLNVTNTGSQTITAPLTPGSYTMNFEAVAPAVYCAACTNWGALAYVPRSIPFTVSGGASIASINPPSGTHAGGYSAVITGTNFTGATAVSIGWNNVPFVVNSSTQITVTIPARPFAGSVPVSVTTPMGTPVTTFTYTNSVNPPVISGATDITPGISHPFTLTTSDIENDQVRYGMDWNMDGIVDQYTGFVNPSIPETVYYNWATIGPKTFQVLAQDALALNSSWTGYAVNVNTAAACTLPWGGSIASGNSTAAYQASSVMSPLTCVSQLRLCTNGTLAGTYTNQNCSVIPAVCPLPWGGSIASGNSIPAYQAPTVTSPAACVSQSRLCTNGTLSGTYANQSCAVSPAAICPNTICESTAGETPLTCPQDCKVKYKTF